MSKIERAELALQAKLQEWSSDSEDEGPPQSSPLTATNATQEEAGASTKSQRSSRQANSQKRGDPLRGSTGTKNGGNSNDDGTVHNSNVIYLGHLPREFGERELERFLGQFGTVQHVRVSRSKKTGGSRGYAFVQFQTSDVATIVADTLAGYLLMGKRKLVCHVLTTAQVHPRLFYKRMPPNRKRAVPIRTLDRLKAVTDKLLAREQEKRDKLQTLGIDYDFPGYAAATTILSDRLEPTSTTPPNSAAATSKTRKRKESDASLEAAGLPLVVESTEEPSSSSSSSNRRQRRTKYQSPERSGSKKHPPTSSKEEEAQRARTPVKATPPPSTESSGASSTAKKHKAASSPAGAAPEELKRSSSDQKRLHGTKDANVRKDSVSSVIATTDDGKPSSIDRATTPSSRRKESVSSSHDESKRSSEKKQKHDKKEKKQRKDSVSSETRTHDVPEPSIETNRSPPSRRKDSVSSHDESKRSSEKKHKLGKKEKKRSDSLSSATETAEHRNVPSSHDESKQSSEKKSKHDKKDKKRKDRGNSMDKTGIELSANVGDAAPHEAELTSPQAQPSSDDRRPKSDKKKRKKEDKKKRRESAP